MRGTSRRTSRSWPTTISLAGAPEGGKAIHYAARGGDRAAAQLAFEEAARRYSNALGLARGGAGRASGAASSCWRSARR